MKFLPVLDTLERIAVSGEFAGEFDEAGWFSHVCVSCGEK
jgi:hypothetical protein